MKSLCYFTFFLSSIALAEPPAGSSPNSQLVEKVMSQCAQVVGNDDNDVLGRGLVQQVCPAAHSPNVQMQNRQVMKDLSHVFEISTNGNLSDPSCDAAKTDGRIKSMFNRTMALDLSQSSLALWGLRLKYGKETSLNQDQAVKMICDQAKEACRNPDLKKVILNTYREFQSKVAPKIAKYTEAQKAADIKDANRVFDDMNAACAVDINRGLPPRPPGADTTFDNPSVHQARERVKQLNFEQNSSKGNEIFEGEFLNNNLANLMLTDTFREEVGEYHKGGCYRFKAMNKDIVDRAQKDFEQQIKDGIKTADSYIVSPYEEKQDAFGASLLRRSYMRDRLKSNPDIIRQILESSKNPSGDAQLACGFIRQINSEDHAKHVLSVVLDKAGVVVGVALMITGIGAPEGAAIAGISTAALEGTEMAIGVANATFNAAQYSQNTHDLKSLLQNANRNAASGSKDSIAELIQKGNEIRELEDQRKENIVNGALSLASVKDADLIKAVIVNPRVVEDIARFSKSSVSQQQLLMGLNYWEKGEALAKNAEKNAEFVKTVVADAHRLRDDVITYNELVNKAGGSGAEVKNKPAAATAFDNLPQGLSIEAGVYYQSLANGSNSGTPNAAQKQFISKMATMKPSQLQNYLDAQGH